MGKLESFVEHVADMCGVYGCGPEDGDHEDTCLCRICFTLGLARDVRAVVMEEQEPLNIRIKVLEGQVEVLKS